MINGNHNKYKVSYKSISSLLKNKNNSNNIKNTLNFYQIYSSNKKPSLISKMKSNNSKYLLNSIFVQNKSKIKSKNQKDNIKRLKQSIGINTSKHSEKNPFLSEKDKSLNISQKTKSKINIEDFNTSSSLYKQYYVGYNKKGEFIDNEKIRELRRNLKTFSAYSYQTYRNLPSKFHDNRNNINKNNSLLTYNFNKDAYSNSQRLLLNISNNNYIKYGKETKKNKLIYKLKRQKTATINNYKSLAYPKINIKNMINENYKRKSFKYNNLILRKDFKNSDSNYFNKKYLIKSEIDKNNINIVKTNKKKKLMEIIEDPNSVLNFIYNKVKELKEHKILLLKNRKKGNRLKLENMKSDLKLIEQEALYQVYNLRYERAPGDEINIKTNLFCSK